MKIKCLLSALTLATSMPANATTDPCSYFAGEWFGFQNQTCVTMPPPQCISQAVTSTNEYSPTEGMVYLTIDTTILADYDEGMGRPFFISPLVLFGHCNNGVLAFVQSTVLTSDQADSVTLKFFQGTVTSNQILLNGTLAGYYGSHGYPYSVDLVNYVLYPSGG